MYSALGWRSFTSLSCVSLKTDSFRIALRYLCDTSQIPLQYLWDTAVVPLRNLRQIPLRHLWACHTHPQVLLQLDAERCRAMQSDAERCRAMQSDAKRCKAMQSDAKRCSSVFPKAERSGKLLSRPVVVHLTIGTYLKLHLNMLRCFGSQILFYVFRVCVVFLTCYSSTNVMNQSIASMYILQICGPSIVDFR